MKTLAELLNSNPDKPIAHDMLPNKNLCIILPGYTQDTARDIFELSDYYVHSFSGGCYYLVQRENKIAPIPIEDIE